MGSKLKLLGMAAAAVSLMLGGCQFSPVVIARAELSFDFALDEAGIDELRVSWWNGTIIVVIDPSASLITAAGTQYARAATQEIAENSLDNITLTLAVADDDATRAELTFDAPLADGRVYGGDVIVTLPVGLALSVRSGNGDVRVTGNTTATTVELGNGDVTISENQGAVLVELGNGDVIVDEQIGDVEVDIANGSANVDSRDGDVNVNLANGSVAIATQPLADGRVIASVANGNITLDVPAAFAATLELTTGPAGDIDADLDAFTVTNYQPSTMAVEAVLNGGGGTIEATTTGGTIRFDSL